MATATETPSAADPAVAKPSAAAGHSETIAFIVMVVVLIVAPFSSTRCS